MIAKTNRALWRTSVDRELAEAADFRAVPQADASRDFPEQLSVLRQPLLGFVEAGRLPVILHACGLGHGQLIACWLTGHRFLDRGRQPLSCPSRIWLPFLSADVAGANLGEILVGFAVQLAAGRHVAQLFDDLAHRFKLQIGFDFEKRDSLAILQGSLS